MTPEPMTLSDLECHFSRLKLFFAPMPRKI